MLNNLTNSRGVVLDLRWCSRSHHMSQWTFHDTAISGPGIGPSSKPSIIYFHPVLSTRIESGWHSALYLKIMSLI